MFNGFKKIFNIFSGSHLNPNTLKHNLKYDQDKCIKKIVPNIDLIPDRMDNKSNK
jgi:hypothetical protein